VGKPLWLLSSYGSMRDTLHFANVLQITSGESGGSALTHLVGAPTKLVSVTTTDEYPTALAEFAAIRGAEESLQIHHGIAQTDRAALSAIAEAEFGRGRIDVVLDDTSQQLEPARSAFETLFPYLREGGRYLLECWAVGRQFFTGRLARGAAPSKEDWDQAISTHLSAGLPVDAILPELLALARTRPGVVSELTVSEWWIDVRRGGEAIDPETFRLSSSG
jgi:hypothetical protein